MRVLPFTELLAILETADAIKVLIPQISNETVHAIPNVFKDGNPDEYGIDEPFFECVVYQGRNNEAWAAWLTIPESSIVGNCIITDDGNITFNNEYMDYTISVLTRTKLV